MGWVALAILGVNIGWVISLRHKEEPKNSEAVAARRPAAEQEFLAAVLESPERLDDAGLTAQKDPLTNRPLLSAGNRAEGIVSESKTEPMAKTVPVCTLPTGKERQLLSDIEKPSAPQPLAEPVKAEELYFWKDYSSLRTDAIRNPNSAANRAGVVSLMQARQRRLGQK